MDRVKICNADKSCTICNIDEKTKSVTFYPVVWESVDSWGRAYKSTSFNRTIKNSNYTVPFLQEHNPDRVIGQTVSMTVDKKGLLVTAKILNTTAGNDAWELFKEKVLKAFSFMGWVIQSEPKVISKQNIEYVTEAALDEVTATLFPANKNADIVALTNSNKPKVEVTNQLVSDNNHNDTELDYTDIIKMIKEF